MTHITIKEKPTENEVPHDSFTYDEITLSALEKRSENAFSGKTKTLTVKQSMDNIKKSRIT